MVVAGLYGVLAQLVSYRRREFGIRLALGATPQGILRMVLRQGLIFVCAGLAVGIVAALIRRKARQQLSLRREALGRLDLRGRRDPACSSWEAWPRSCRRVAPPPSSPWPRCATNSKRETTSPPEQPLRLPARFLRFPPRVARTPDRAPGTLRPLRSLPSSDSRCARFSPPGPGSSPCS